MTPLHRELKHWIAVLTPYANGSLVNIILISDVWEAIQGCLGLIDSPEPTDLGPKEQEQLQKIRTEWRKYPQGAALALGGPRLWRRTQLKALVGLAMFHADKR